MLLVLFGAVLPMLGFLLMIFLAAVAVDAERDVDRYVERTARVYVNGRQLVRCARCAEPNVQPTYGVLARRRVWRGVGRGLQRGGYWFGLSLGRAVRWLSGS